MAYNPDTVGACASSAGGDWNARSVDIEALRKYAADEMNQKMQAIAARQQDVYTKPEPPTLLIELHERLSHTREGLRAGVSRIHAFNNRVLGAVPESNCGTKSNGAAAPCSGDALRDLVTEIAMLTEELLGAASRVERIG